MVKKKNIRNKILIIVLIFMILATYMVGRSNNNGIYAASSSVTGATQFTIGSSTDWSFELGSATGTCCQPSNQRIPTAGTGVSLSVQSNSSQIAKTVYQGVQSYGSGNQGKYIIGHAVGYLLGNISYNGYQYSTQVNGIVNASVSVPDNFRVYIATPSNGGQTIVAWETIPNGALKLVKTSSNPTLTNGNSCYSLAGAVFYVYSGGTRVGSFTTDASGNTTAISLAPGTYTVKEVTAPKGYALASDVTVTVTSGNTTTFTVADKPQSDPVSIVLKKVDKETNGENPLAGARLEGAEYTVKFYAGEFANADEAIASGNPVRTWVLKTDSKGVTRLSDKYKVSGDDFYTNSKGVVTLPFGGVTIQETKAPTGYKLDNTVYFRNITSDGILEDVNSFNIPIHEEQIERGDLEFTKVEEKTDKPLAGVKFRITSKTTGESHILITDNNGYASTKAAAHTNNTNAGESSADGIWFGQDLDGNTATADDTLGSLPYDTYIVEELRCKENIGYKLAEPVEISVTEDKQVVDAGKIINKVIKIGSTALDNENKGHLAFADENVTIVDTVSYTNLEVGKNYVMRGSQIDKSTGKVLVTKDNDEVVAETAFTCENESDTVEVIFKFDGREIGHKEIVSFEKLYEVLDDGTEVEIANHEDINDKMQTVNLEYVGTLTLIDKLRLNGNFSFVQTGDTTDLIPYVLVLGVGIIGSVLCALKIRSKRKEKRQ